MQSSYYWKHNFCNLQLYLIKKILSFTILKPMYQPKGNSSSKEKGIYFYIIGSLAWCCQVLLKGWFICISYMILNVFLHVWAFATNGCDPCDPQFPLWACHVARTNEDLWYAWHVTCYELCHSTQSVVVAVVVFLFFCSLRLFPALALCFSLSIHLHCVRPYL